MGSGKHGQTTEPQDGQSSSRENQDGHLHMSCSRQAATSSHWGGGMASCRELKAQMQSCC